MQLARILAGSAILLATATGAPAQAPGHNAGHGAAASPPSTEACSVAGPQSPRDIARKDGSNHNSGFPLAPAAAGMNLCNLHFHRSAEHRSAGPLGFSDPAGAEGGFKCSIAATQEELRAPAATGCGGVKPGDTIEVHWVFSSCAVKPGVSLKACVPSGGSCQLRVESQVFLLVNNASEASFAGFDYRGQADASGRHQPKALPTSGAPVVYRGSTTNAAYNSTDKCSPTSATWSVRPACAKLDINSLHAWCKGNTFNESHAHGPRPLVSEQILLSRID